MITPAEAHQLISEHLFKPEKETLSFEKTRGRISAEPILADRDLPPFNRVTKDGVALHTASFDLVNREGVIETLRAAGDPQYRLKDPEKAVEIMTGSPLPLGTDAVVMYEEIKREENRILLQEEVTPGQNIHPQGQDAQKGDVLLKAGSRMGSAEIGLLASVGKTELQVHSVPKVAIVATGNELILPHEEPAPHQIRMSNVYSLQAGLEELGIPCSIQIIRDDKELLRQDLASLLEQNDLLICSGGVSKGRYDYLPEVLPELGIQKVFHRVRQKPGKPLWFGADRTKGKVVFALPGNPASTFSNFILYVLPWLRKSLGLETKAERVVMKEHFYNPSDLWRHIQVKLVSVQGQLKAELLTGNGSGDLVSLAQADGLISIPPQSAVEADEPVAYQSFQLIL